MLNLVTNAGVYELPEYFLPSGLFKVESDNSIERNQDATDTIRYGDGVGKAVFLEIPGRKRFTSLAQRDEFIAEIRAVTETTERIEYNQELFIPVTKGWANVSFSPSVPAELSVTLRFVPSESNYQVFYLDAVLLSRSDITLSNSDILLSTERYGLP